MLSEKSLGSSETSAEPAQNESGSGIADSVSGDGVASGTLNRALDKEALAEIVESGGDALIVLDSEWRYHFANDRALPIMGKTREQLIGHKVVDVFPEIVGTAFWDVYNRAVREQKVLGIQDYFPPLDVWFDIRVIPHGDLLYLLFRDVTAQKRAEIERTTTESKLSKARKSLDAALLAGDIATWTIDLVNDRVTGDTYLAWLFSVDPAAAAAGTEPIETYFNAIHKDDREYAIAATTDAITNGAPYAVDVRVVLRDGTIRWISSRGKITKDASGTPLSMFGAVVDITERRAEQEALRVSEEQLRDAQMRLNAGLSAGEIATWTFDIVNNRVVADSNLAALFSVDPVSAAGGELGVYLAAIHPDDRDRVSEIIANAIRSGEQYEAEYRVVMSDGSARWLVARGKVERDTAGAALSLPGVVVNITERVEREQRERFLADLAERTRSLTDGDAIVEDAVTSLGKFLHVDRCLFVDIDFETDTCRAAPDYRKDVSVASMSGTFPLSAFGEFVVGEYRAGNPVVVDDARSDRLRVPDASLAAYEGLGIRAHISVPLVHSSRLVSCLGVHSATPRRWKPEEVELLQTVVERTWLMVEVARQQRALQIETDQRREQGEYLRRLVESSPDNIKTLDLQGRVLSINEGGLLIMEADSSTDILGAAWLEIWKDDVTRAAAQRASDEARAGGTGRFQGFCPTFKGTPKWWDVVVAPLLSPDGKPEQLLCISRDITDQKQLEARDRANSDRDRARLTDIFDRAPAFMTALRGPEHRFEMANPLYLKLIGRENVIGKTVAEVIPEMVEQGFIGLLDLVYQSGEAYVGSDTSVIFQLDPDSPADEHFVDFSFLPLFEDDGSVSGILVHGVDLTDRKLLEQERERLLDEQRGLLEATRAHVDREALLNRIGAEVRVAAEPEAVARAVVSALGEGLAADRCYFVRYNQTRDTAFVTSEWLRDAATTTSIAGRSLQMSTFSVDRDVAYREGLTHVVDDVIAFAPDDAAPLLAVNIRSLLRVPIEVGDQMTALAVSMAHAPRHWTEDEIRLTENAAILLHSALESSLVQQRERNIARQLQAALQPVPPSGMPGLGLASFYRPALEESSVGGDFFDVFPLAEGCVALVVADLSGKGLQAASQVSTVRNMLRFALYSKQTVLEAITGLHNVLVDNELLTGFATLFAGVFDADKRTLTYVNCGQEAGLVWRASTGAVEQLAPTGPVLGGFVGGAYADATVTLARGDIIFAGTDGMTEVGPNRKQFLQATGLTTLFAQCAAAATSDSSVAVGQDDAEVALAALVVEKLMAGVEAHAGNASSLADDIALLVGVVK